ncbi:hypothetical protein WBG78_04260 [Chryseolinea sp. T2]|uniref:HEAT repeat domain-containing protein n=1 Tax=Chryseolinea sp. T2 TaxID=3129255 RepID=UPI003076C8FF
MGFWDWIFVQKKATGGAIESHSRTVTEYNPDFDAIQDLGQIASKFDWVFHADIGIATKCARAIHRLFSEQSSFEQSSFETKPLYKDLRNIYLKKSQLEKFDRFEEVLKLTLLSIASMNSDGYVRQEALNRLLINPKQSTFRFILFRLSDWVPAIRLTAEKAIGEVIRREDPEFLIRHHKLIDSLLKVGRSDLKHIHDDITTFIFSDDTIGKVLKSLEKYSDSSRFFIVRNLIQRGKLTGSAMEEFLSDKNYLIRLLVIRNVDFVNDLQLMKRLLGDRSQKIRQYAVNRISDSQIDAFKTPILQLLFDSSAGIRAAVRGMFSRTGQYDFPQIYRDALVVEPGVGSIVGLAEVGAENDLSILEPFLKSPSSKLRAAGLFGISILDNQRAKSLAFDLLSDDSNTVKKMSCLIIQKGILASDVEALRSMYDGGTNETKRFILKTISSAGGWSIAGDLLKSIVEEDKNLRETGYALLERWSRYSTRLGTTQHPEDGEYVMGVYKAYQLDKMELPYGIEKL